MSVPRPQFPGEDDRSKDSKVPDVHSVPPKLSQVPTSAPKSSGQACPAGVNYVPSTAVYKHRIQEAETVVIEPIPHIKDLRYWKNYFYKTIGAASGRGALGMRWVQQTEKVYSM